MKVKTKAVFWMVLLTVSGFILGGVVTYLFIPTQQTEVSRPPWSPREMMRREAEKVPPPPGSEEEDPAEVEKRARFVNMWKEKLDLTEEQASRLDLIFKEGHQKMEASLQEAGQRYREIRRETDEKILEVLDGEQAERYRQITSEYRARRARENQGRQDGERRSGRGE